MCIYICSHFAQVLVTFALCDLTICAVFISAHMAIVLTLIYSLMLHGAWPMEVAPVPDPFLTPDAHLGGAGRGGKDDDDDPNKKWKGEWLLNL